MIISFLLLLLPIPVNGTIVRYRATYYPRPKVETQTTYSQQPILPVNVTPVTPASTASGSDKKDAGPQPDREAGLDVKINSNTSLPDQNVVVGSVNDASASTVPALTGPPTFFGVFKSVWRTEQFEGIFKGFFPALFLSLLFARFYVSPAPVTYLHDQYTILPYNLVYIPYLVATYRIIVNPHKFRLAEPKAMYRLIFTEYERGHPFRFFQYSGLIMPLLFGIVFDMFVYQPLSKYNLQRLGVPFDVPSGEDWYNFINHPNWMFWVRLAAHFSLLAVCVLLFTPVDVIVTRLAMQPVHGPPRAEPAEERDMEKLSADAAVIAPPSYLHLTTEQQPYLGFVDCFQRIVKEEGWGTLYRCWWLTILGFWIPFIR
ncbi:hypothetical protein BDZ97DRAFT_1388365 [Flammula alnicola]|nr:hypothetical protein BDZ97DRAFT_1388365 [Flammula alnicola]